VDREGSDLAGELPEHGRAHPGDVALVVVHTRGRGRSARIFKPFSNLTIIVRQTEEAA
jgi:hypothetical protein